MSRPKRPVGPPDHSPGRNPGWPDDVRERNPGWWGEIGRMRDFFYTVRTQGVALGYRPAALQAAPGTRPIFANHFCLTITGVRRAAIHPLILEGAPLHDGCKPLGRMPSLRCEGCLHLGVKDVFTRGGEGVSLEAGRVSPPRRGGCLPRGGEGVSLEAGRVSPSRQGGCFPRCREGDSPKAGKVFPPRRGKGLPHIELTSMKTLIALARRRRRPDRLRCR